MFSAQQILLPGILNKRVGLPFTQTDTPSSERFSMPDDARERIFPEGLNLRVEQNEATDSQIRKEEGLEDKRSVSTGFSGGRETANEDNVDTTNHESSQAKGSDSPSIESNNKGKNPLGHGAAGDYSVNPKDALAQSAERKHSCNPKNTAYNENSEERKSTQDDVSSEAHEIREQARRSRDPEAGENIL